MIQKVGMNSQYTAFIVMFCFCISLASSYNWDTNPGDGSSGNPYQISTAEQLNSIGSNAAILDKDFILTADIDMAGYTFDNSPIAPDTDQSNDSYTGENTFSGSLDGQGHRILNLKINRTATSYNIGLIGVGTSPWKITNLGLVNINITIGNSSKYIGGLIGRGYSGTVSSCYITGSITGGAPCSYMGSFCGQVNASTLTNCYNESIITNGTGSTVTGGAVGYLAINSRLDKCYSVGSVNSGGTSANIGALVGISNNSQVNDCFFLTGAGPDNGIGAPKSAFQLTQITTFTNAGWEIVDAMIGNEGYWRMRSDGPDYPYLLWEFKPEDFYGDFEIDMTDFIELSKSWKSNSSSFDFNWLCDLNRNLVIDLGDLNTFCTEWMESY